MTLSYRECIDTNTGSYNRQVIVLRQLKKGTEHHGLSMPEIEYYALASTIPSRTLLRWRVCEPLFQESSQVRIDHFGIVRPCRSTAQVLNAIA